MVAIYALLCAAALPSALASCAHLTRFDRRQEAEGVEAEGEKAEEAIAPPKFGYGPLDGPHLWHRLAPENALCANGTVQSPVDLDVKRDATLKQVTGISMEIEKSTDLKFENRGTNVELVISGKTTVDGRQFNLLQAHFHTPSEHRINGVHFSGEIHMVHEAADGSGDIAVIGLPIEISNEPDQMFHSLLTNVEKISEFGQTVTIASLDTTELTETRIGKGEFISRTGSLTTPPCAEGLAWFVATEPVPVSVERFNALRTVVGYNARPIQNLPGEPSIFDLANEEGRPEGVDEALKASIEVDEEDGAEIEGAEAAAKVEVGNEAKESDEEVKAGEAKAEAKSGEVASPEGEGGQTANLAVEAGSKDGLKDAGAHFVVRRRRQ